MSDKNQLTNKHCKSGRREEPLQYRCLILDHDDTAVQSTPDIHYPSFVEALKTLRPDTMPLSLEQFVSYCFEPGFGELCNDILKFSQEEQERQYQIWKRHTQENVPDFYPGFPELLRDYKQAGGVISVVSHSESGRIARDYQKHCGFAPDLIFGWELEASRRKPNSYPILETMQRCQLKPEEILVVDDLKPGLDMARNCNVKFAAAGWSHLIPDIRNYMRLHSDFYFTTVDDFKEFILAE